MKLLDTNILIYSFSESYDYLRPFIWDSESVISDITRLEVLGFHSLTPEEEGYFQNTFLVIRSLDVSKAIINEAILLRQKHRMKLGDSIIAATALFVGAEIYTRNTADFEKIPGLKVVNPID